MATFSARPHSRRSRSTRFPRKAPPPLRRKPRKAVPDCQTTISRQSPLSFVYVGNLRSDVRVKDLERLFTSNGTVPRVDIRCCSGSVVPSSGALGGTVYATVLFDSMNDATRALSLNGDALLGNEIVVAASFLSLPEAKRGVTPKSVQICGVNFTRFSDKVHRVVDKFCTGGTQIFPVEGA